MTFLAPLLAGLAALGSIPILIHLLNKSRFRIVDWAAMEFLLRTLQKNSRRLQLRDLILMALRTLAIVFAALALGRPTIRGGALSGLGAGGVTAVIVLDESLSMSARDAAETRFEKGRAVAQAILEGLPRGSQATLVLMSDVANAEVAEPTSDIAYLREALAKAKPGDGGTSVAAGLREAWAILAKAGGGAREIYLVTDLSAQGWPAADERAWSALVGELAGAQDVRLTIADVGGEIDDNVSIERVELADEIAGTDGVSTVVATLRRHGPGSAPVGVDLLLDDGQGGVRPAATATTAVSGSTQVRLEARFERGGRQRLEVRCGPDRLESDNVRRMVVDVVDKVKVLVIDGSAEGGAKEGALFLRAALSPSSLLRGAPADAQAGERIETTVVAPAQVAALDLDDFHTVILNDVGDPGEALAEGLRAYVASGRGLITFLGGNARPEAWNRLALARGLLPGTLGDAPRALQGEGEKKDVGMGLSTADLVHPIASFFAAEERQPFLAQPRFRRAWPLTLPAAEPGKPTPAAVVAAFADGQPAIVASSLGRGQIVTFLAPADREWSDLPLRPLFLMVLRRAVQIAALGDRPRLTIGVHEPLSLTVPAREGGERFVVRDPHDGERFATPVTLPDGRAVVEIVDTRWAGFWRIERAGEVRPFAVNPPSEESALERLSREAVAERLPGVRVGWIGAEGDVAATLERERTGREIWPLLLTLAIACLLAEALLARRWAPRGA